MVIVVRPVIAAEGELARPVTARFSVPDVAARVPARALRRREIEGSDEGQCQHKENEHSRRPDD